MLNKNGKLKLAIASIFLVVIFFFIFLPTPTKSDVGYPSDMSIKITTPLEDNIQAYGSDYAIINTSDETNQVVFYSGQIAVQDDDGIYQPFTSLANVTYENYYLNITFPDGNFITYAPYMTIAGSAEKTMVQFLTATSAEQKVYIYDYGGSFKFGFNITNIAGINVSQFRLVRFATSFVSEDFVIESDNSSIKFGSDYALGLSDLTEAGFTLDSVTENEITIGNTSSNLAGGILWLDPTVTLQTAGTHNLKDAYVLSDNPDTNYGTEDTLLVRESNQYRAYITFNLSEIPNSTINSANISFYEYIGSTDIAVHEVYNGWVNGTGSNELNETQLTYNNQPCGTDFTNSTNCNLTATDTQTVSYLGWTEFDITNVVQKKINNNLQNASFIVKNFSSSGNYAYFASKEYSDTSLRPKLIIDYTLGEATNESCGYVNSDLNLSQNISHLYGDCLIVNASDITIDCKGYSIIGADEWLIYGIVNNANRTTIKNCSIYNFDRGIRVYSPSGGVVSDNIIQDINFYSTIRSGIVIESSANNTYLNRITTNSDVGHGITCNSDYPNIMNNSYIDSTGGTCSDSSGLWIAGSGLTSYDSVIINAFCLFDDLNVINSTFSSAKFQLAQSKLNVSWYADIYVNDSLGNALNNSNITAKDVNSILQNWSLTNSSGYTPRLTLQEYMQNGTAKYPNTNYTFNGTKTGYQGNPTYVNLTANRLIGINPIVVTMTILSPTPTFVAPTPSDETWRNYNYSYINVTTNLDSDACNLTWNGTNTTMDKTSSTMFYYNQTSQPDGAHTYNVTCNSTASGLSGTSETREIYIDTTTPQIFFTSDSPSNASYQAQTYANIIVNLTEAYRDQLILAWNESTNHTSWNCEGTIPDLICNYNKTGLSNGVYTYYAWVNDSASNVNVTEVRTITIDTTLPSISLVSPTPSDDNFSSIDYFPVNVSITNADNYANHTYYLFNSTSITNTTTRTDKTDTLINYTGLSEETYEYNVTVCNLANSCSSTSTRTWTYDATDPEVNFTEPTLDNENSSSRTITIKVNYTEANPSMAFLNFSNASNPSINHNTYNTSFPPGTDINMTFILYSIPTGNWTFYVRINDTSGRNGTTETRWVNVNATSPVLTLVSPENPTYSNISSVNFTCNATSTGVELTNISIYSNFTGSWVANETVTVSGFLNQTQFNKTLSDDYYVWNCQACDTNGDCDFYGQNYSVTADTSKPNISYAASSDLTDTYTRNYILVNVSATSSPSAIDDVIITWSGGNYSKSNTLLTCVATATGYDCYRNFTGLANNIFTAQAFTSDMAGNTNNTTVQTYTIDATGPSVLISSPTESQTLSTNSLPYTVTTEFTITNGIPIDTCWYNVSDLLGNPIVASTIFGCGNTSRTFPINTAGSYYLNMHANTTNQQTSINRLFLLTFSPSPPQGGGALPETNLTCICGNGVCEEDCGENTLTCSADCSNITDLNTLLRDNWLVILLVVALIVVVVVLVRRTKKKSINRR